MTLKNPADYESNQKDYQFDVVADDGTAAPVTKSVTVNVTNDITASGAIQGGSLNKGSGSIQGGAITGSSLNASSGGITNAGAISGATTITASGDIETTGGNIVIGDTTSYKFICIINLLFLQKKLKK